MPMIYEPPTPCLSSRSSCGGPVLASIPSVLDRSKRIIRTAADALAWAAAPAALRRDAPCATDAQIGALSEIADIGPIHGCVTYPRAAPPEAPVATLTGLLGSFVMPADLFGELVADGLATRTGTLTTAGRAALSRAVCADTA